MSEREKEILERICVAVPKLDESKKNYVLGVVDGLAAAKDCIPEEKKETS